jgi:hypothetical protein
VHAHTRTPDTEQEAAPWWNKLTGRQAAAAARPHEQLQHKPMLEAERILMVDFVATQAQAKGAAPSANDEGGQTEAAADRPPIDLPPPATDGVDRMYHQLAEIHTITAMQLVECAH